MSVAEIFQAQHPEFSIANPSPTSWDRYVQSGNPGQYGIIRPDLAAELTEEEIVLQIIDQERESGDARAHLDMKWWGFDDFYRMRTESSEKQEWQADIKVPEVRHKVHTLKSLMQSALVDPEKFFVLIKESQLFSDVQVRFIDHLMQIVARRAELLPTVLAVFEEAFLYGTGILKISIESEQRNRPGVRWTPMYPDPAMMMQAQAMGMETMRPEVVADPEVISRIQCSKVHARNFFPDPLYDHGKGRYEIERWETDREWIDEMVRLGIYDSAEDIGEGMRDLKRSRFHTEDIPDTPNANRKRDVIQDFTGNLYKDGVLVARNWIVTVGNERKILRIGPNPIWSGASRYIVCTPIPYQGRPWGESPIEADAIIEKELKSLLDLMIDDTKYAVLGAFLIDENKNNGEPIEGITPGEMYDGDGEFVRKLNFASNANTAWPLITHLQGIGDKSTMVNEFAAGTPSSRGRPTATEVQSKTGSSTGHIHNMARGLEQSFLEPALNLMFEYIMQFGSEITPEIDELAKDWGGSDALRDPVRRFAILDVPFRFQVRGISMVANRESMMQRLMQIMQMTQQLGYPPSDPLKFMFTMIGSTGFAPEQIGYTEGPEQYQAFQQAQMMQQQGGGGPNMGAPGGPGGSAGIPAPSAPPSEGAPNPDQLMNRAQGNIPSV